MKSIIALLIVTVIYIAQTSVLFAYEVPNFTSCINPQGEIKVNYETGTHGIVGSEATYSGKDTVYTLSGEALTQCFCATDGKGIQTNWWKVSALTEAEINSLKLQGWNYVPNGALWGLEQTPYLALNSDYSCKDSGSAASLNNTGSSASSTNGSGNSASGGSVAGVSAGVGQVLGLASTGNSKFFYGVLSTSFIALSLGLFLKKRANNYSK